MMKFLTSLFSSSGEEDANGLSKDDRKKFDILKYDGVRAQKIGKLAYAVKCFTEALAIQEDIETMSYLVGAYTMGHEPEKALEVLDRMLEIDPELLNTYFTRIGVLFQLNEYAEIVVTCQNILNRDSSNYLACFLMGKARKYDGNLDEALQNMTQAIELNKEFFDAYLLRAEIRLEKGMGEAALADVEQVIGHDGEEESAYLLRGNIHVSLKNTTAAEEDYNQVLALNPFNEEAALRLADLLVGSARHEEALEVLNELIELSPSLLKAYQQRAEVKVVLGDAAGADADSQKAKELREEVEELVEQTDFNNMYKGGIY